jgi:DNA-binding phage protein
MDEYDFNQFYTIAKPYLNERSRRLVAAGAALVEGKGGISKLSRATGLARQVIRTGIKELTACFPG